MLIYGAYKTVFINEFVQDAFVYRIPLKTTPEYFCTFCFFSFFILIQLVRELWTRSLPYPPIMAKNRCKRQKEFMEGPLKNSQNLKERTCAGVSFLIGSQLCQKRGSSTVVLL